MSNPTMISPAYAAADMASVSLGASGASGRQISRTFPDESYFSSAFLYHLSVAAKLTSTFTSGTTAFIPSIINCRMSCAFAIRSVSAGETLILPTGDSSCSYRRDPFQRHHRRGCVDVDTVDARQYIGGQQCVVWNGRGRQDRLFSPPLIQMRAKEEPPGVRGVPLQLPAVAVLPV